MVKIQIWNAENKFTDKKLFQIFRVSIYQVFMMLGVKLTTPAIASAMPNLGPGFIFVIAAILRYETKSTVKRVSSETPHLLTFRLNR
jgi:hypothetical protein